MAKKMTFKEEVLASFDDRIIQLMTKVDGVQKEIDRLHNERYSLVAAMDALRDQRTVVEGMQQRVVTNGDAE